RSPGAGKLWDATRPDPSGRARPATDPATRAGGAETSATPTTRSRFGGIGAGMAEGMNGSRRWAIVADNIGGEPRHNGAVRENDGAVRENDGAVRVDGGAVRVDGGAGSESAGAGGDHARPSRGVVIVGSGFAGFTCARRLCRTLARRGERDVEIVLVTPNDYMLYTPLLPRSEEHTSELQSR